MFLMDYHMHSLNSSDAHDEITTLCDKAIARGLQEIAITDHFEPSSGNEQYLQYNGKKYFSEISEARQRFEGKIKIKSGVELGQPHRFSKHSLKLIEEYPYDYVLGSAHRLPNNVDFGEVHYTPENLATYCAIYLLELKTLAQWDHYDCLGHLDLVKRYAANYQLRANLMDYQEQLAEILKIVIQKGKGIEVNTSGLRQSSKECLPGLDIIRLYKELGGEIITVGSDAHWAEDVGKGIPEGMELIRRAGFNYVTVYTNRKPTMIKIGDKPTVFTRGGLSA
ncbi:histidinol phosphate phosphatase HisJ family [Desulfitobacterium dehalogenans ATCC 51507]|uniref:Histidinol-phosphatase n=1 Tax=Desulfitobacterium dehalogenans (strain ATCC 51507 / DSM 9161 / JW/IU-DC1) TaxID=756499 RepID=I4A7X2_DESDJ|nr:histidinol-phosphatase HisJ family protein [Desulfitobacterium dehalogenans]AFM00057.1 histidinol phosphate phosphatase HisJ family [Desulfitobacterium dehalogenans ATCC 51507]